MHICKYINTYICYMHMCVCIHRHTCVYVCIVVNALKWIIKRSNPQAPELLVSCKSSQIAL